MYLRVNMANSKSFVFLKSRKANHENIYNGSFRMKSSAYFIEYQIAATLPRSCYLPWMVIIRMTELSLSPFSFATQPWLDQQNV